MPLEATSPLLSALAPSTLAEALILVSWWKAALILPPFLGWAWLVSKVFDKHAGRFYLKREAWNILHLSMGILALVAVLAIPVPQWWTFFAGYALMLLILGANILIFVQISNADERVTEGNKLKLDLSKFAADKAAKKDKAQQATVQLGIIGASKELLTPPKKETPEYEVRAEAERLYLEGADKRASRMDIGPTKQEGTYAVTYIVDGVRQPGEQMPAQRAITIIDFWKAAAGLDTEDRRRRLTAMMTIKRADIPTDCKIVTKGGRAGMELNLIVDPKSQVTFKINDLGLGDKQLQTLKDLEGTGGVFLLAGTPMGGRTSSLYTFTQLHDAYTSNIQTIEAEVQLELEGIRQLAFDFSNPDKEFSTEVRSLLRRDPDVLCVAELPDAETAKEVSKVEAEHTRVYQSLVADSALAAIDLYVRQVGNPKQAAETLRAVAAQKLMRRLCENCKVTYQPTPDLLKKLGLPADKVKQLVKKGGQVMIKNKPEVCPVCQGIGYVGQVAAFEVFTLDDNARQLIADQNWPALRNELRKLNLPTIQQAALRKVVAGETSLEEFTRVTAPPKKKSSKPATKKPAAPAKG